MAGRKGGDLSLKKSSPFRWGRGGARSAVSELEIAGQIETRVAPKANPEEGRTGGAKTAAEKVVSEPHTGEVKVGKQGAFQRALVEETRKICQTVRVQELMDHAVGILKDLGLKVEKIKRHADSAEAEVVVQWTVADSDPRVFFELKVCVPQAIPSGELSPLGYKVDAVVAVFQKMRYEVRLVRFEGDDPSADDSAERLEILLAKDDEFEAFLSYYIS